MNKPLCIKILGDIKESNEVNTEMMTEGESEYEERSVKESITEN
jgi:hypothetical protein